MIKPTPEERALFIDKKLFMLHHEGRTYDNHPYWMEYDKNDLDKNKWLSSPNGLTSVENAMVARGYCFEVSYMFKHIKPDEKEWRCYFWKGELDIFAVAPTKPEAILIATYLALQKE